MAVQRLRYAQEALGNAETLTTVISWCSVDGICVNQVPATTTPEASVELCVVIGS